MASVHESLYFNPMMTNGVVHANVFGIKDWVTPYKMALLVLIRELGRTGPQLSLLEKRRLNRLLLPLLQGPDMTLSRLIRSIDECCSEIANSVQTREEEISCNGPLSQKQAEYFLSQQASLLKNDETKALSPASLQKELNNLLKFNPDFAEAHYLSYLNSLRVQDVFSSTHSLLHYFDRLILTGAESKSNGDEGYGRSLRYAALNLAALHCRFGHYHQAELALQEAIRIAQESNDHVCLQHCLSWLHILEQKRLDSCILLEHSVKKAVYFGLPYLASLGIQSLVQQRALAGKTANKLMDALKDSDLLHWKHSLSELIDISIAQKTAIWRLYGRSTMALQQAQMLLSMNSLEAVNVGVQQNNTESFAVVLCHLAELHAEQGYFTAASEILKHLKERFPTNSQHAQLWMLFDQKIQFDRAMNDGRYHVADSLVAGITALNSCEGVYSVLLSVAELYWQSLCHTIALPVLLQALALAREYRLQYLASETILNLAFAQLILGIPEQALSILHMAIEPILAHGAVLDKGAAMFLVANVPGGFCSLLRPCKEGRR
ncbi:hypothetical protein Chor_012930 [Crotalus horridus]